MPNELVAKIEQKPEYLILGAVGIGVVLFMMSNRGASSQLPKATGATQVTSTPATDTVSLGTVQQQIADYQKSEQDWILATLESYYAQYNGQPPTPGPDPNPGPQPGGGFIGRNPGPQPGVHQCGDLEYWDAEQGRCVSYIHPIRGQGGGEGPQGAQLPLFGLGGGYGRGGDRPGAPALTGKRFESMGIRGIESGF